MEEFQQGERWSASLETIVPQAAAGRVWRLFLGADRQAPALTVSDREALLNAAALHTLAQDGEVLLVEREQLPGQAAAAAIFRHSA